jgi:hypothetical protein
MCHHHIKIYILIQNIFWQNIDKLLVQSIELFCTNKQITQISIKSINNLESYFVYFNAVNRFTFILFIHFILHNHCYQKKVTFCYLSLHVLIGSMQVTQRKSIDNLQKIYFTSILSKVG